MKTIQIRHVPDETHTTLRRRAAESGMSLQEFLLATLNEMASRPTALEVLTRAGGRAGGRVPLEAAVDEVRAGRDRR